jgi:hypothetical protein
MYARCDKLGVDPMLAFVMSDHACKTSSSLETSLSLYHLLNPACLIRCLREENLPWLISESTHYQFTIHHLTALSYSAQLNYFPPQPQVPPIPNMPSRKLRLSTLK